MSSIMNSIQNIFLIKNIFPKTYLLFCHNVSQNKCFCFWGSVKSLSATNAKELPREDGKDQQDSGKYQSIENLTVNTLVSFITSRPHEPPHCEKTLPRKDALTPNHPRRLNRWSILIRSVHDELEIPTNKKGWCAIEEAAISRSKFAASPSEVKICDFSNFRFRVQTRWPENGWRPF